MKILRVRRGFTTNSSASSEWIPPPPGAQNAPTQQPATGFTPVTKIILPMNMQQHSSTWSNVAKGGGLVAIVALAFIAERIARMILRKKRRGNSEGEDES